MCNDKCVEFGREFLTQDEVEYKDVLEIGSKNINGSLRNIILDMNPSSYIGIDLEEGDCVDQVCSVYDIIEEFGVEAFDIVITTEMMEHVEDWRKAINNMKSVLKPGGIILITTRSKGFGFHNYPADYWRYELSDMEQIFSDFKIEVLKEDTSGQPGVFIKAIKPEIWYQRNLDDIQLYDVRTEIKE